MKMNSALYNVNVRFFHALEVLATTSALTTNDFCDRAGLDPSNFRRVKRFPANYSVPMQGYRALVKLFGISGDWLLAGIGPMFRK